MATFLAMIAGRGLVEAFDVVLFQQVGRLFAVLCCILQKAFGLFAAFIHLYYLLGTTGGDCFQIGRNALVA